MIRKKIHTFTLLLAFSITPTLWAVSAFKIDSDQALSLFTMQLQTQIQQSRPGDIRVHLDTTVSVDDREYDPSALENAIESIIQSSSGRGTLLNNPSPNDFGPLWDFEIIDQKVSMKSDSALVNCRFQLVANGLRENSGQLVFIRQGRGWRLCRLNGLLPFLISNNQATRSLEEGTSNHGREK